MGDAERNGTANGPMGTTALRRVAAAADLQVGDHLLTPRRGYAHHGIYVGDGKVVHYAGLFIGVQRGPVAEVPLAQFAAGHAIWIKSGVCRNHSGVEIAERARSRLGEDRYRLLTNNCEHFCEWCVCGQSRSQQVARLRAWPRLAVLLLINVLGQVFGAAPNDRAGAFPF